MHTELNRRDVLKTIGGAGLAAVFGARALDFLGDDAQAATTCLLTPEATEGPYWVDTSLTRRDVRSGKAGLPLVLRFTILNARTCSVIKNADVEIWHCDALGNYSAVNGASSRFLRGHQKSNASGKAEFLTIFPGWYRGRTPHIHMKVYVGRQGSPHGADLLQREDHGGRLQAGSLRRAAGRTTRRTRSDNIYEQAGGSDAQVKLAKRSGGFKGYVGTIAIGIVT